MSPSLHPLGKGVPTPTFQAEQVNLQGGKRLAQGHTATREADSRLPDPLVSKRALSTRCVADTGPAVTEECRHQRRMSAESTPRRVAAVPRLPPRSSAGCCLLAPPAGAREDPHSSLRVRRARNPRGLARCPGCLGNAWFLPSPSQCSPSTFRVAASVLCAGDAAMSEQD